MGRPRRRWEDNIRMDLEEIGINAGNLVDSALDRNYWRALVNLRVPYAMGLFRTICFLSAENIVSRSVNRLGCT